MSHRLFKSEPTSYSFDDLVRDGDAEWDGVRNFQVRNWLRDDIQVGDKVVFWHSNSKPIGAVGTAVVVRSGYPDHTAWDPGSDHPDPRSSPDNPIWYMVDIRADKRFDRIITMDELRSIPALSEMIVLKRGNRLSITRLTEKEFKVLETLGS